jgi:SMC interacting uncharacterized protein involved in chromosome segregation
MSRYKKYNHEKWPIEDTEDGEHIGVDEILKVLNGYEEKVKEQDGQLDVQGDHIMRLDEKIKRLEEHVKFLEEVTEINKAGVKDD